MSISRFIFHVHGQVNVHVHVLVLVQVHVPPVSFPPSLLCLYLMSTLMSLLPVTLLPLSLCPSPLFLPSVFHIKSLLFCLSPLSLFLCLFLSVSYPMSLISVSFPLSLNCLSLSLSLYARLKVGFSLLRIEPTCKFRENFHNM
jgi:hypothetical protein